MADTKRKWMIYSYIFPNGKRYVGKTKRTLSARKKNSKWEGYQHCPVLWRAIEKYGVENIREEILVEAYMNDSDAAMYERYYIALYKTNITKYSSPSYGYNMTDGGEGVAGWHPNEEQYQKRKSHLQSMAQCRRGVQLSEDHKKKLSAAHTGRQRTPMSESTKQKISRANSVENMSAETRTRRSRSKMKPVIATNKCDGSTIEFRSEGGDGRVLWRFSNFRVTLAAWDQTTPKWLSLFISFTNND